MQFYDLPVAVADDTRRRIATTGVWDVRSMDADQLLAITPYIAQPGPLPSELRQQDASEVADGPEGHRARIVHAAFESWRRICVQWEQSRGDPTWGEGFPSTATFIDALAWYGAYRLIQRCLPPISRKQQAGELTLEALQEMGVPTVAEDDFDGEFGAQVADASPAHEGSQDVRLDFTDQASMEMEPLV